MKADVLLTDIGQLVTFAGLGEDAPYRGPIDDLPTIENAAVAMADGVIVALGPQAEVAAQVDAAETHSAGGRVVLPGFVDPHTHLPWAGSREGEFAKRLAGTSYAEIAQAGGGIRATMRATRQASLDDLLAAARPRLARMLSLGTTTAEAKSGYGLELDTERRQLEAIARLDGEQPVDLVATNLAAHEIPDEHRDDRERWIRTLIEEIFPALKPYSEFCDVFCEDHVFTVEESRRILGAAKDLGYKIKLHADELVSIGGAQLAVELGAVSADHLAKTGPEGIAALAESNTVAVLLPGTSFYLGAKEHAPARAMIEAGVPIALATDANPGSCLTESMPMILTLACVNLRMTPAEALVAATVNAAWAIDRRDRGVVAVGKRADLVVWNAPSWRYLPTHFGVSLVEAVIKSGAVVYGSL